MQEYYSDYNSPNGPNPSGPNRPKRHSGTGAIIITAIVCLIVGALVCALILPGVMDYANGRYSFNNPTPQKTESPAVLVTESPDVANGPEQTERPLPEIGGTASTIQSVANPAVEINKNVGPSVVGVINKVRTFNKGESAREQEVGSGSGIIISADGYIVTNNHVVENADALTVLLRGGEEVKAELVGTDVTNDIAVLKIDRTGLKPAPLGDSDAVEVGEVAIALGNPLGTELANTLTQGVISATGRRINVNGNTMNLLQTDAAINPGNSGGALVNGRGEVIGINNLKSIVAGYDDYGNTISSEGIGFAIPINDAKPIIEQLIKYGKVIRPGIGIMAYEITDEDAQLWDTPKGILVNSVVPGGPSQVAGVLENDIILKLDGKDIASLDEFLLAIRSHKVGDKMNLHIWRDKKELDIAVTVGNMNEMKNPTTTSTTP